MSCLLSSRPVQAQDITDPAAQTLADTIVAAAAPDTTRLKATALFLRLDRSTGELRQLLSQMAPEPGVVDLSQKLPNHLLEIDSLVQIYENLPEFRLSLRDLDNISRIWERLDLQSSRWGEIVYSRLEDLQVKRDWVKEKREAWAKFQITADSVELRLVQDRVARLNLNVDSLDTQIRLRLEVLFGLSDSLNVSEESLLKIGNLLEQRTVDTRIDMFVREGPILPMLFFRDDLDMAISPQFT